MNRDIWTIVFDDPDELFLLKNQIKSLIKYKNTLPYNLIINHNHCGKVRMKLDTMGITDMLNSAPFPTSVFDARDIIDINELHPHSYINQQILKLHVYRKSNCSEHIILDAKDIAVKEKPLEQFNPKRHIKEPINFVGAYEHFLLHWHPGIKIMPVRPPSTPYLFRKNVLVSMEKSFKNRETYIQKLHGQYLPQTKRFKKIDKRTNQFEVYCISEFIMYNLYEQLIDPDYKEIHGPQTLVLYLATPEDDHKEVKNASFLSLHRKRVKSLGLRKAQEIINSKQSGVGDRT